MKLIHAPLLGALAVSLAAAAATKAPDSGLRYIETETRVDIDASGKVVALHTKPELPADVTALVEGNLRALRFAPPMKDGRAVSGVTFVRQDACAVPKNGAYRFAIKMRGNGPSLDKPYAPVYPREALMAGAQSKWKVSYAIETDGTTRLLKTQLVSGGGGRHDKVFQSAISGWLRSLHFTPETLDGQPVATQVDEEVDFVLDSYPLKARADAERERTQGSDACKLALSQRDGAPRRVALDSPFKLLPVVSN